MVSIRPISPDDLAETAALHRDHLRLGLFPRLGRSFLRLYQETFAKSPYGIALVAKSRGRVVGALFGTTANADHYRWVVQNCGWDLGFAGGRALLLRPHLAWTFATTRIGRYARGLRRHLGAAAPETTAPAAAASVLSHIVTDESVRRSGVGRQLVEAFKIEARRHGARRATLVTEEGGLGAPFFERIGCTCVTHRQGQDGITVREYRLLLNEAETHERIGYGYRGRNRTEPYRRPMGAAGAFRPAGHPG